KELQRQLGVTYKCAWRMGHQIRKLLSPGNTPLEGIVEVDEAVLGRRVTKATNVIGAVERNGKVKATIIPEKDRFQLLNFISKSVKASSRVITDALPTYKRVEELQYTHEV